MVTLSAEKSRCGRPFTSTFGERPRERRSDQDAAARNGEIATQAQRDDVARASTGERDAPVVRRQVVDGEPPPPRAMPARSPPPAPAHRRSRRSQRVAARRRAWRETRARTPRRSRRGERPRCARGCGRCSSPSRLRGHGNAGIRRGTPRMSRQAPWAASGRLRRAGRRRWRSPSYRIPPARRSPVRTRSHAP
jgi:hypothetical protein